MKKEEVSISKFYMLRCLMVMAHADGVVSETESAYVTNIINRVPLSPRQREIIERDFKNPPKLEDLLPHITEPAFRGQVVDFARIMAHRDGVLDPSEKDLLRKLYAFATKGFEGFKEE